ncbi:hypothetical protein TNCV_2834321 [Trichonephila clavipes]|nr:hypothetical protein TNCV_2834321 [Trichonephila clavipes]
MFYSGRVFSLAYNSKILSRVNKRVRTCCQNEHRCGQPNEVTTPKMLSVLEEQNLIPQDFQETKTWVVERGKFYDPVRSLLKSKNQEINRLQLAVKLPWAIFFESVDILS